MTRAGTCSMVSRRASDSLASASGYRTAEVHADLARLSFESDHLARNLEAKHTRQTERRSRQFQTEQVSVRYRRRVNEHILDEFARGKRRPGCMPDNLDIVTKAL